MKSYFLSVLMVLIAGLAMARPGAAQTVFESAQVTFTGVDSVRAYIERHTISRSEEGFTQRLQVSGTGTTVFSGGAGSLSRSSTGVQLRLALGRVYSLRTGNPNRPEPHAYAFEASACYDLAMRMLANPGAFVLVVDLRGAPAAHLDLGTAYIDSATSATNITSQLRAAENTSCQLQRAGR